MPYTGNTDLHQHLEMLNPPTGKGLRDSGGLRYLFLASQVGLLDTPKNLGELKYESQSETLSVGVVKADGKKCDLCWNYSTYVGQSKKHPLLCDRCEPIIANLIVQNQIGLTEDGSYQPTA